MKIVAGSESVGESVLFAPGISSWDWTLVHKGNPVRPRAEFLVSFLRFSSGSVDDPDLSDPMEMESCRVGRSISVGDGTIHNVVDQGNLDRVEYTHWSGL